MKTSILEELRFKVFQSGNPLYLFIGLNVGIFLLINLLGLIEFLFNRNGGVSQFVLAQLVMPANVSDLLFKPWTLLTYMFTQQGFFHLLFNMLWLFWLGRIFTDFLNKRQFIFTYIVGGLAGAVVFLLLFNFLPAFEGRAARSVLLGSSAAVSAIIVGAAVLVPDYTIRLLFFGNVKLKYLAIAFIVLDLLGISGGNAGGSIAHLGGALFGYLYIVQLRKGDDWSKLFTRKLKARKTKFTVHRNTGSASRGSSVRNPDTVPDQDYIDSILDKISQSGYQNLTAAEKDALFKASKQDQN